MVATEKKYTLDELKLGTKVYKKQLSEIYDTYIILTDVKNTENGLYGIIGFIGSKVTNEVKKLRDKGTPMTSVYNNSDEMGDDVVYEE